VKDGWKKAKKTETKRKSTEATDRVALVERALKKLDRQELMAVEYFCRKRSNLDPMEGYNLLVYYTVKEVYRREGQA